MIRACVGTVCGFICLAFVLPGSLFAATDDSFTVTQTINTLDPVPPTTPLNFTVVPVTSSQINLDWDPSSDNIGVDGYQVFRDSVQIATTSATAYFDTGLTPSTTYAYNVIAFDVARNFSTSTAVLSTTTLPFIATTTSPTATSTGGVSGYYLPDIELIDIRSQSSEDSIALEFTTNRYARFTIRWGRTNSYELGYTGTDVFQKEHRTFIDSLTPGTTYQIEIILLDEFGSSQLRYQTEIITKPRPDDQPPANVSGLTVFDLNEVLQLTWQNPPLDDFAKVRVLSNDYFYPIHSADGWLVYDGTGETVIDRRSLASGATRYYTVFVYDTVGNISSGAIVAVTRDENGAVTISTSFPTITPTPIDDISPAVQAILEQLQFADVIFMQDGSEQLVDHNRIQLSGSRETLVRLAYDKVPEHLKTIMVTLRDPDDENALFSFLLRINQDKSYYEARVGALEKAGVYDVTVTVIDFKTSALANLEGEIEVVISEGGISSGSGIRPTTWLMQLLPLVGLSLLLLLITLLISKRRYTAEDKGL